MKTFLFPMLATLALAVTQPVAANDVRVIVTGIELAQGEISCALYSGGDGFPHRDGDVVQTVRYPAAAPMLTCTFEDVEPGRYAVSVVHDENANQKIDTNLFGFSKEPWGVSNNVRSERSAPRFTQAAIQVSPDALANFEVALAR